MALRLENPTLTLVSNYNSLTTLWKSVKILESTSTLCIWYNWDNNIGWIYTIETYLSGQKKLPYRSGQRCIRSDGIGELTRIIYHFSGLSPSAMISVLETLGKNQ